MEYNIYLDVFFLRNFALNLLLLKSLQWLFWENCAVGRMILAAGVGSLCNCLWLMMIIWDGRRNPAVHTISIFTVQVCTALLMIRAAFPADRKKRAAIGAALCFLAFCAEGAMRYTSSTAGSLLVPLLAFLIGRERRRRRGEIRVILSFKGRQKEMQGFYDSGNRLAEPLTGKMVHIACYGEIRELLPDAYQKAAEEYFQTGILESTKVTKLQMYEFTFLSYHSIGKETGQLLGIRMDSAVFMTSAGKKTEEKAVIGLTEQKLFVRGQSRIIINGRLEI